ncbi:uncharacterized protein G2W53_012731 [Senna tora]|uniref:Uncharacterized protein n=1 Tax=Senna tora TaxID=362788 RepID=A0A834TX91_9FABA|nr:uncharacterized protein G2W53_012731 [Senna tora]
MKFRLEVGPGVRAVMVGYAVITSALYIAELHNLTLDSTTCGPPTFIQSSDTTPFAICQRRHPFFYFPRAT